MIAIANRLISALLSAASLLVYSFVIGVAPMPAQADDLRPLLIDISEYQQNQSYKLQWRIPPLVGPVNFPVIKLPKHCTVVGHQSQEATIAAIGQRLFRCQQSLAGSTIHFHYPHLTPAVSTIIKFSALNGERHTQLLKPAQNQWQIPRQETATTVARDYTLLGIAHIWAGMDHLLFVLCLLWIAGSFKRVLVTITGFTLAHSITLVVSAMQWVILPIPPIEAAIALSIIFLAVEIAKNRRDSLTWRYPVGVASSFGLLHGFGFAAALSDIGLPQTERVTGLIFFNMGVEIGQVLFAVAILSTLHGVRTLLRSDIIPIPVCSRSVTLTVNSETFFNRTNMSLYCQKIASYCIGILSSAWFIERLVAFL